MYLLTVWSVLRNSCSAHERQVRMPTTTQETTATISREKATPAASSADEWGTQLSTRCSSCSGSMLCPHSDNCPTSSWFENSGDMPAADGPSHRWAVFSICSNQRVPPSLSIVRLAGWSLQSAPAAGARAESLHVATVSGASEPAPLVFCISGDTGACATCICTCAART